MHGFTELEARGLLGTQVRPRRDMAPAAWCGQVVGAESAAGGWELLVQGSLRGIPVLLHCGRADFDRFLFRESAWKPC